MIYPVGSNIEFTNMKGWKMGIVDKLCIDDDGALVSYQIRYSAGNESFCLTRTPGLVREMRVVADVDALVKL